jgi:HK97 family phage major capsid protein
VQTNNRRVLVDLTEITEQARKELAGLNQRFDEKFSELEKRMDNMQARAERPPMGGVGHNPKREMRPGEVRILKPTEKLADLHPCDSGIDQVSAGRVLRAQVLGRNNFLNEAELKILNEGTGSAGGFTVPTPLSAQIIDLARNRSVVNRAGAGTVLMPSATLTMARLAGDPTAGWTAENAAITASDLLFEKVTFTAHTLAALCKMSIELFEDGQNIDQVVSDSLAAALAIEMDRAALFGDGSGALPTGVYSQANVQAVTAGGPLTDYSKIIAAIKAIYDQNGEPNAMVYSPRTWSVIEGYKDTTNQPLRAPASIERLAKFVSNQVPVNLGAGTNESPVIIGDFSQMMIGLRTNLTVEASRVASDGTSRAFESKQVFVRAYLRCDIQLAHPKHFVKITGVTP